MKMHVPLLALSALLPACATVPSAPQCPEPPRRPEVTRLPDTELGLSFTDRMGSFLQGKLPEPTGSAPR